jgi:hypothetical protein
VRDTCEYLARVGFAAVWPHPTPPAWADDDGDALRSAEIAACIADHHAVADILRSDKPEMRAGDLAGVRWGRRTITWPDRVPGLVTWSGQQNLAKVIIARQRALGAAAIDDLFAHRVPMKGASGLDAQSCPDALDMGFSTHALGMEVMQRPAVELLAIIGLETLPLVSFGPRECGFLHGRRLWRFAVEARDGGYYYRWAALREEAIPPETMIAPNGGSYTL